MLSKIKNLITKWWLYDSPYGIFRMKYPSSVVIETTNACNIRCALCPIPSSRRKKGLMKLKDFKIIVDKLPETVKRVNMNWAGEPLLNKNIFEMVKILSGRGVFTHISTNGMLLHNFDYDEILNSGLGSIAICIDGATKKVHEKIRRGSDFDRIVASANELTAAKKDRGSEGPKIIQQTLVWKESSKQKEKLIDLGKRLGVDEIQFRYLKILGVGDQDNVTKKIWPDFELSNKKILKEKFETFCPPPELGRYKGEFGDPPKNIPDVCSAFSSLVVLWNGDVTVCCFDSEGLYVYGNLLNESINEALRKLPRRRISHKGFQLCRICDNWEGQNIEVVEL